MVKAIVSDKAQGRKVNSDGAIRSGSQYAFYAHAKAPKRCVHYLRSVKLTREIGVLPPCHKQAMLNRTLKSRVLLIKATYVKSSTQQMVWASGSPLLAEIEDHQ